MRNPEPADATTSRIERIFARIGLVAVALLVPIAIVVVDLILTPSVSFLTADPTRRFSLSTRDGRLLGKPEEGALRTRFTPGTIYEFEPNQTVGPYRINSHGLRGPECDCASDRPRWIVFGGSAAFGLEVGETATFAARLARSAPDTEVLNAGVIGYLSGQELSLVVRKLLDFEPDVLVALDGWNDVYDPYWWSIFGGQAPHFGVNTIFGQIEDRLHAYRRVRTEPSYALLETTRSIARNSTLLSASFRRFERWTAPEVPEFDASWRSRVATTYVRNVRHMHELARSQGTRLIVVVQPELGQMLDVATRQGFENAETSFEPDDRYWKHFPPLYAEFRRDAVAALEAAGIEVIDASNALRLDGLIASELFIDPVHLSERGHRRMSRLLLQHLQPAAL